MSDQDESGSVLWHSNKKQQNYMIHNAIQLKDMWEKEEGAFLLRLEEIYISGKSLGTVLKYWSLFLPLLLLTLSWKKKALR